MCASVDAPPVKNFWLRHWSQPAIAKVYHSSVSTDSTRRAVHRQSSRSLLANVLDLEDNFLLLNLAPGARTTTQCAAVPHAPASVELPSLQAPLSPAKDIPLLPDFLCSLFSVAHCLAPSSLKLRPHGTIPYPRPFPSSSSSCWNIGRRAFSISVCRWQISVHPSM